MNPGSNPRAANVNHHSSAGFQAPTILVLFFSAGSLELNSDLRLGEDVNENWNRCVQEFGECPYPDSHLILMEHNHATVAVPLLVRPSTS